MRMRGTFGVELVGRLSLAATLGLAACTEPVPETETETVSSAMLSENGMSMNGMSMNGMSMNGMSMNGMSMNGMSMNGMSMNGLNTANGLSSFNGLMTTVGGRDIVKYMVKCALPLGRTLVKQDQNGATYSFSGSLGVAPEFENDLCGPDCQERVSACMLAHVNNAGVHIALWLDSEGAIGWGQNPSFPYQEGSFFGNLFPAPWTGYFCNGKGFDQGAVPGRLGAPLASNVYVDPFGANVECSTSMRCTAHGTDGYDSCTTPSDNKLWKHVVTAWRNYDPKTLYKICNFATGKCLGVSSASTADGAAIEQRGYTGAAGQTWSVLQLWPGSTRSSTRTAARRWTAAQGPWSRRRTTRPRASSSRSGASGRRASSAGSTWSRRRRPRAGSTPPPSPTGRWCR